MALHDLDGAVGPAEALLLEVDEGVRHQPLAEAVVGVGGRVAFLEHAQAQLGVLADGPVGPAQLVHHRAADHRHGAVLDDRVAVVAGDHADVEEALVLGVAELLEQAFVLVAIVLRRLHHGDSRVGEVRDHVLEPVAVHAVVRVDHRDDFGVGRGVRQDVVQRAALEAVQRCDVEEAEARAELLAVVAHRLPDRGVLGVVVDDQDFEIRIVEVGQCVEGLFDHLRRLVVAGHVHRDLGPVAAVSCHRDERPAALVHPDHLGQFVGLGEQHDEHAEGTDAEQRAHRQAEPGGVLLAVVVADPHQCRTADEGDEGQEGAAALAQRAAIDQQQGQREQRHDHRGDCQQAPLRNRHHRAFEGELGLPIEVVDAPVGAHRALVAGLPRLVEGLDDEVVVALAVKPVDQRAQVHRLIGLGGVGAAAHAPVARPADFGDQQRFLREQLAQVARAVEDELPGVLHRDEFPVRQHVGSDQVGVLGQLRVLLPDVPLLGGRHRHLDRRAHAVHERDQLLGGDFLAKQRLVAHGHANHAARVVGQIDGLGDLALVAFLVVADPDAQGHAQAELLGDCRNVGQRAVHRVGADVVGVLAQQLQVLANLRIAGIDALLRALALAERRIGEAGDLRGPVRRAHRAVVERPETGEQRSDGQEDHQIETKFSR